MDSWLQYVGHTTGIPPQVLGEMQEMWGVDIVIDDNVPECYDKSPIAKCYKPRLMQKRLNKMYEREVANNEQ